MSGPLVSCLLVTYNQEAFVAEALHSALAQTYSPLEIVVSDDASSDGTYEVLDRIIAAYSGPHRVTLRRNSGRRNVVGHIAEAVPFTSGELIVLAAGDDVSLPDRVARLVDRWEKSNRSAHALNSDLQQIDAAGKRGEIVAGSGGRPDTSLEDFVVRGSTVFGASAAYSRAVLDRFGPLDPFNIFEDQVLPFRAALLGQAVCLNEVLVLWRRLPGSNSMLYLHGSQRVKARLTRLIYQQQQQACYQRQRVSDIDHFVRNGGQSSALLQRLRTRLARLVQAAEVAGAALQRPVPLQALSAAVLRGKLSFKQAVKLYALYRMPLLSAWWFRLRTLGR